MKRLHKYLVASWSNVLSKFIEQSVEYENGYHEALAFSYSFNPSCSYIMSLNSTLFDMKKAAAMFYWYKVANPYDKMIIKYFREYERCIDDEHTKFNSNYGFYAYRQGMLKRCVAVLERSKNSRQAMFCINNNEAMSDESIDKLCTNTIQFFIRGNVLQMIVQMRSSNFITLLPYDAFMFSVFYCDVFNELKSKYHDLEIGKVNMQVASLHLYEKDIKKIQETKEIADIFLDPQDNNWKNILGLRLSKQLYSTK